MRATRLHGESSHGESRYARHSRGVDVALSIEQVVVMRAHDLGADIPLAAPSSYVRITVLVRVFTLPH